MKKYRVFKDGTPVNGVVLARNEKEAIEQVFKKLEDLPLFSGMGRDNLVATEVFYGESKT